MLSELINAFLYNIFIDVIYLGKRQCILKVKKLNLIKCTNVLTLIMKIKKKFSEVVIYK